ncbi:hypothetical protein C8Q75DRAFT_807335 [Abortiporus biennis]|nr:hypothetical protein C8Q75DRAFT_807335 [Abortiporus biennis]
MSECMANLFLLILEKATHLEKLRLHVFLDSQRHRAVTLPSPLTYSNLVYLEVKWEEDGKQERALLLALKAPLKVLKLFFRLWTARSEGNVEDNPIPLLQNFQQTLEQLDTANAYWGFEESQEPFILPHVHSLTIKNRSGILNTAAIVCTFPNLRHLSVRNDNSEEASQLRSSNISRLHRLNSRGIKLWSCLKEVRASDYLILHGLGLLCPVDRLAFGINYPMKETYIQDACIMMSELRPSILNLHCFVEVFLQEHAQHMFEHTGLTHLSSELHLFGEYSNETLLKGRDIDAMLDKFAEALRQATALNYLSVTVVWPTTRSNIKVVLRKYCEMRFYIETLSSESNLRTLTTRFFNCAPSLMVVVLNFQSMTFTGARGPLLTVGWRVDRKEGFDSSNSPLSAMSEISPEECIQLDQRFGYRV